MLFHNSLGFPLPLLLVSGTALLLGAVSQILRTRSARSKARRNTERLERIRAEAERYFEQYKTAGKEGDEAAEIRYGRLAAERMEESSQRARALELYALVYGKEGNYLKATAAIDEAIRYLPSEKHLLRRISLLEMKGTCLLGAGWYTSAYETNKITLSAIENYIRQGTDDASSTKSLLVVTLYQLTQGATLDRSFEEAYQYTARMKENCQNESDRVLAQFTAALILHTQERFTEAIDIYNTLVPDESYTEIPNGFVRVLLPEVVPIALSDMGLWDAAIQQYNKALARLENRNARREKMAARYRAGLANIYMEQGDYVEAERLLASAVSAYPPQNRYSRYIAALSLLVKARSKAEPVEELRKQVDALRAEIDQYMESFPYKRDALRHYLRSLAITALVLYEIGDTAGCLSQLNQLADKELRLGYLSFWDYWRGRCFEDLGNKDAARTAYTNVVTVCSPQGRYAKLAREKLTLLDT